MAGIYKTSDSGYPKRDAKYNKISKLNKELVVNLTLEPSTQRALESLEDPSVEKVLILTAFINNSKVLEHAKKTDTIAKFEKAEWDEVCQFIRTQQIIFEDIKTQIKKEIAELEQQKAQKIAEGMFSEYDSQIKDLEHQLETLKTQQELLTVQINAITQDLNKLESKIADLEKQIQAECQNLRKDDWRPALEKAAENSVDNVSQHLLHYLNTVHHINTNSLSAEHKAKITTTLDDLTDSLSIRDVLAGDSTRTIGTDIIIKGNLVKLFRELKQAGLIKTDRSAIRLADDFLRTAEVQAVTTQYHEAMLQQNPEYRHRAEIEKLIANRDDIKDELKNLLDFVKDNKEEVKEEQSEGLKLSRRF